MLTENVKNRGYFKIKSAASAFNFDFKDKVVLDIGSSTGGFTQYALDRGAKQVIAIEKGTNQMASPLRLNSKVELHEKTDIFTVGIKNNSTEDHLRQREQLASEARDDGPERSGSEVKLFLIPDVIMADVSFISLKKILFYAKKHLAGNHTEFLVMMKPQFEARPDQLNRGVVKNESIRRAIIKDFEQWLKLNGYVIIKKHDNDLKGKNGNQERFYYLKLEKK